MYSILFICSCSMVLPQQPREEDASSAFSDSIKFVVYLLLTLGELFVFCWLSHMANAGVSSYLVKSLA